MCPLIAHELFGDGASEWQIIKENPDLPPESAVRCCHDPFFIKQCATTVDWDFAGRFRWICVCKTDLPTDLALDSSLASNDSMNPIFRWIIPICYP